jgi:hypothetical protein
MDSEGKTPKAFIKIINDFIGDIERAFPEYKSIIQLYWKIDTTSAYEYLYKHCLQHFPTRLADIVYKNEEIFNLSSDIATDFLPGISFKFLWNCEISESTKESIWKYLQLILFYILSENQHILDNIKDPDLRQTCNDIIINLAKQKEVDNEKEEASEPFAGLETLLDSKLGKLAKEIAEESKNDLDLSFDGSTNPTDILQALMKNPAKFTGFVQSIGDKLKTKMDSGEINQEELFGQAEDLFKNVNNVPGMPNMFDLFSSMKNMMDPAANKISKRKKGKKIVVPAAPLEKESPGSIVDKILNDEELYALFDTKKKK